MHLALVNTQRQQMAQYISRELPSLRRDVRTNRAHLTRSSRLLRSSFTNDRARDRLSALRLG